MLTVGAVAAEKGQTLQIETMIFGFNKIILTDTLFFMGTSGLRLFPYNQQII